MYLECILNISGLYLAGIWGGSGMYLVCIWDVLISGVSLQCIWILGVMVAARTAHLSHTYFRRSFARLSQCKLRSLMRHRELKSISDNSCPHRLDADGSYWII